MLKVKIRRFRLLRSVEGAINCSGPKQGNMFLYVSMAKVLRVKLSLTLRKSEYQCKGEATKVNIPTQTII